MKVFDGKNLSLGRLASHVAKESLKGEEIIIVNCDQVIITGNKKSIEKDFNQKRGRVGSSQRGPKHSATSEKIVKRTIRGMLPNYREGRGRIAFKKIKCYVGIPKEYQESKKERIIQKKKIKFVKVKEFTK